MSFTCYASIVDSALHSIGPPAQIDISAQFSIVDTSTNTAVVTSQGGLAGTCDLVLNCPVGSQASLLPQVQSAIQAQEAATPSLSFIWIGL